MDHRFRRRPGLIWGACALGLSTACFTPDPPSGFTRRDSLGIEIVESTAPLWADGHAWSLSPAPALEIGTADGPEDQQLFRVFSALRLSDDRIFIANSGSGEMRFYDPSGSLIRSTGGRGAGPGEFGQFASMQTWLAPGGQLLSYDGGNERVNIFDTTGTFLRTVYFEQTPEAPRAFLYGALDDGTWLGAAPLAGGIIQGNPGDLIDSEFLYVTYSDSGQYLNELFRLPTRTRYTFSDGRRTSHPFIPLLSERFVVAARSSVYVIAGQRAELEVWSGDGTVKAVWRWPAQFQRRVADVWDRYKREILEEIGNEDNRRYYANFYEEDLPLPDVTPAATELFVDRDGFVWIERYKMPWDEANPWDVFAPTGEWLGWVDVPRRLRVMDIGQDYILGNMRDDLGVERIQIWTLRREPTERTGIEM